MDMHMRLPGAVRASVLLSLSMLMSACGDGKPSAASQTAAKVNKEEINVQQIDFALQQQRDLKPEQEEGARRQALERLIDQELAFQKADQLKLDRAPRVALALQAARREIVARAYVDKITEDAAKPSAEEVQRYYDEHPALFAQRRIYNLQEVAIEAPAVQFNALRDKLAASKTVVEFLEDLKKNDVRFGGNQLVRSAEQLPPAIVESLAVMRDGQALILPTPGGAQVVVLAGSRAQPVTLEQARAAIEQFLLIERRKQIVDANRAALRAAAAIEYVGKYAERAPSAEAPAAAAAAASDALDAASITKGMGLK